MMAKAIHKCARIEIEFSSAGDLKYALDQIFNAIKHGEDFGRKQIANAFCQYQVTIQNEPEFRIEELNGKMCMIFKSKMNENGK